jgi:cytochrome P450
MLFLTSNPSAYRTLQAEIDSTNIKNVIITDEEAKSLPYLQAVIKEGSRMWPPATGLMPKVTPPEGDTFKGVFIPGGVDIGKSDWAIQRNKDVFGDDSGIFRPERWLEAKGEKLERMERTVGLVFGYGKYMCLGKSIAMLELNKVLFHVSFMLFSTNEIVTDNKNSSSKNSTLC